MKSIEQLLIKSQTQQGTDNDYVCGQVNTESVNRYLPYPTTPHQPSWECEKKAERLACLVALAVGAAQKLLIAAQRSSCQSCMTSCMGAGDVVITTRVLRMLTLDALWLAGESQGWSVSGNLESRARDARFLYRTSSSSMLSLVPTILEVVVLI